MRNPSGFTLIEIVLSILILAFAIIPISDFLGKSGTDTRMQFSEGEAMQFACDKMDFLLNEANFDTQLVSQTDVDDTSITGKTEIKWTIQVVDVPLADMPKFKIPKIAYHSPCNFSDDALRGKETKASAQMENDITTINDLSFDQLDKERLAGSGVGSPVELKDLKVVVKWKFKGAPVGDFERHPIILISRRGRL